jgi:hypothetical protein
MATATQSRKEALVAIQQTRQTLTLEGVTGIIVSDIATDDDGVFVRRLYLYTEPSTNTNRRPDIELLLYAATKDELKIETPNLEF